MAGVVRVQTSHLHALGVAFPFVLGHLQRTHDHQGAAWHSAEALRPEPLIAEVDASIRILASLLRIQRRPVGGFLVLGHQRIDGVLGRRNVDPRLRPARPELGELAGRASCCRIEDAKQAGWVNAPAKSSLQSVSKARGRRLREQAVIEPGRECDDLGSGREPTRRQRSAVDFDHEPDAVRQQRRSRPVHRHRVQPRHGPQQRPVLRLRRNAA